MSMNNQIIRTDRFRAWLDEENTGHIKILRRVNFITVISILRQITMMQKNMQLTHKEIRMYIPSSLSAINSENLQSVIEFLDFSCDMKIIVIVSEDSDTE